MSANNNALEGHNMRRATPVLHTVPLLAYYQMEGYTYAETQIDTNRFPSDYDGFKSAYSAIEIDGKTLIRTSFNSDRHVVVYTDRMIAGRGL